MLENPSANPGANQARCLGCNLCNLVRGCGREDLQMAELSSRSPACHQCAPYTYNRIPHVGAQCLSQEHLLVAHCSQGSPNQGNAPLPPHTPSGDNPAVPQGAPESFLPGTASPSGFDNNGTVSRDWDTPILGVTAALAACEVTNPTKLSPCNAPASPEPGTQWKLSPHKGKYEK